MKKPVVGLALGLFALLFMLSSAAWAVSANEQYNVADDVASNAAQITQGNLLSFDKDNKQTLYTPLNGGVEEGQWLDFVDAWQLAAAEGGAVTLQQDVLVAAADAPEGIFVQVPEGGQVMLNLNGHRLAGEDVACLIFVGARGRLIVTDSEQGGGQIFGVVGVDDNAEDEDEWGQIELLGDVEIVDPQVMVLADAEAEAEYYSPGYNTSSASGSFESMWALAISRGEGTVKLLKNVTAVGGSFGLASGFGTGGYILVPSNNDITLDLNGYDLDRRKTGAYAADGYVIRVAGTLTIKNSNDKGMGYHGYITGGHTNGNGGGIYVESDGKLYLQSGGLTLNNADGNGGAVYLENSASFEMTGGYIYTNEATGSGGAIYMESNANFNIKGGIITGNKACTVGESGGAIYVNGDLRVSVSGSAKIYDNVSKKDDSDNKLDNVYLKTGNKINVSLPLDDDAVIGIRTETKPTDGNPVVVVEGTNLVASKFVSDDEQYETALVGNNQIVLKAGAAPQAEYTKDGETQKGTFEEMWNLAVKNGGTVKLLQNVMATDGSFGSGDGFGAIDKIGCITVPQFKTVTLDLNGHKINRALSSYDSFGSVIRVIGVLNLENNVADGEVDNGIITGGYANVGGGIYVNSGATLNISNVEVSGNKATDGGGGISVNGGGKINISGKVIINNNTVNDKANNLFLPYDEIVVNANSGLSAGSQIGISLYSDENTVYPQTVVQGKSLNLKNFFADDENYHTALNENNEIVLEKGAAPQAEYTKDGTTQKGSFEEMWNKAAQNGGTVKLLQDITATGGSFGSGDGFATYGIDTVGFVSVPSGKDITLDLNGFDLNRGLTQARKDGYVIYVSSGGELTLKDSSEAADGVITGGYSNGTDRAGGVQVLGTLNMYGGTIADNNSYVGGGVYNSGTFILNDGKIVGNKAYLSSGGGVYNSGTFILNGGKIIGNKSDHYGGGVYNNSSKFEMSGGEISANTGSTLGGGLFFDGESGNYVISGGLIKNNEAPKGAGIWMQKCNLKITGGKICENEALYGSGGGINVTEANLYLSGGEITGNTVGDDKYFGVGVYIAPTANIYVSGAPKVYGNKNGNLDSNVYLSADTLIQIESDKSLTDGAHIGVNTENAPTAEASVTITNETDSSYAKYFFADDSENYHVEWNETDRVLQLAVGATVHEHNNLTFTAINKIEGYLSADNYYLTGNITLDDTVSISGEVNICLNGYGITGPTGKPAFKVPNGAILNIYNEEGNGKFAGLAGSGGIEVAGGGTLNMVAKSEADSVTYAPAAGNAGGTVTVDGEKIILPGNPTPGTGDHMKDHPDPDGKFQAINAENLSSFVQEYPAGFSPLPEVQSAYKCLKAGYYYLDSNFIMPYALVVLEKTDFCLNGMSFGADNDTWLYELEHVFWVPEKTVLNVFDCQRDLHIVWLYGGRVFLKNGAQVNISGNKPGFTTNITMGDNSEGEVKVEIIDGETIMTLPAGATLTQTAPGKPNQIITNNGGVLEITQGNSNTTTKIIPPRADAPIKLKLPAVADEETPDIVLEAPANSTVQTEKGPTIKLEQPGEVEADGTVNSPEVTVTTTDPATKDEVQTTVTAPDGEKVQVNTDGEVQAPADSTVAVDDVVVKIEEIGSATTIPGGQNSTATISPSGDITLPADSKVTASNPKKDSVEIVIALPADKGDGTLNITDNGVVPPAGSTITANNPKKDSVEIVIALPGLEGGSAQPPRIDFGDGGDLILPPETKLEIKNDSVTIVIALPKLEEGGEPPHIDIDDDGNIVLPPGTEVTVGDKEPVIVDKDKPVLNPDNGDLLDKKPDDPNKPVGGTTELKPNVPVQTENGVEVERKDDDTITIKPADETKPQVTITPQPNPNPGPDDEPAKEPVVDKEGNVFIDEPFKVQTTPEGPEISTDKGGSVTPDGGVRVPGGSTVTVKPTPDTPDKSYKVTLPEQGGEVKLNPDKTITLPAGSKVVDPNGKETTISSSGGTLNPSTGAITGAVTGGSNSGSSGGGGGSSSASYIITASASIGGEISPDKRVTVSRGADQTFTIKPAEGYVISDVLVDGKSVGQVTSYTFSNVRAAHTIQALFVAEGMSGHGHQGDCPKDETCPIWPYTDAIPTAWYHDGVHYCIEYSLMIGTGPALWEPNIPFSRAMMAQVLYNKAGRPEVSGEGVFDDVDNEWYWPAITWGGRNEVLWGYGDGNYGPQDSITREQLATLLWRYSGQPQVDSQLSFSDAAEVSDYAKQALSWASQHGVITGYPDGTFRPQGFASRAEAAQMIMRYFNL